MARMVLVDTLEGKGVLESSGLAPLPVRYWLRLHRKLVDVGGGETQPGLFNLQGEVGGDDSHALFPYFSAGNCDLVLSDGLRIGIFLKSAFGDRVPIAARDANALAQRYSEP